MRKWTAALPVAASFGLSVALFNRIPSEARPDFSPLVPLDLPLPGPASRLAVALLLPIVSLAVWLLLTRLAKVRAGRAPLPQWLLNENTGAQSISRFEPTYETIIFGVTALLLLMHIALLVSVLGLPGWSFQLLTAAVGVGMVAIGNVMPRLRPNWIAGVRTKRTLTDPIAWAKTHRRAGALTMIAGLIVVALSIVAPAYALVAGIGLLLLSFPIALRGTGRAPIAVSK